jgi:hypothetical protein
MCASVPSVCSHGQGLTARWLTGGMKWAHLAVLAGCICRILRELSCCGKGLSKTELAASMHQNHYCTENQGLVLDSECCTAVPACDPSLTASQTKQYN